MDWSSDALVICTRNGIDDIKRCLTSVEASSLLDVLKDGANVEI
jgi:hypothetical protein